MCQCNPKFTDLAFCGIDECLKPKTHAWEKCVFRPSIRADRLGAVVVHRAIHDDGYVVSHFETGFVAGQFADQSMARKYAEEIGHLALWKEVKANSELKAFVPDELANICREALGRLCGFGRVA